MKNLFGEIVNESLINEIKQDREKDIKDAINNVLRVRIYYNDRKGGKGKNERYILPVAFGLTKSGKKAIRAYQTAGSSKRGLTNPPNPRKIPKWKLFLMDNIYMWANGKKSFRDYKDALINLGLNTHGDKSMTTIFAITPFADDNVQVAKDTDTITNGPVKKSEIEPTAKLQSPKTTDKEKFIPAVDSRENSVDNTNTDNYFVNKVEAPKSEPVSKAEVNPESPVQVDTDKDEIEKMNAGSEPVTKDAVESGDSKESAEDVKAKFNDLLDRMSNLNKDEDEKEE